MTAMTAMLEFLVALIRAVASIFAAEPMIYLFGMILLCFVCKAIKTFLP